MIKGVDSRKVKFATTYADLHTNQGMRADVDRIIGVDSGAAYATGDPIDAPVFEELARRWNAFEPDGEVAQLRAEVEQLRAALSALGPVEYEIPYHGIAWQPCSELNMDCKTKRAIRRVLGEGAA